jgi:hypothetical protein
MNSLTKSYGKVINPIPPNKEKTNIPRKTKTA